MLQDSNRYKLDYDVVPQLFHYAPDMFAEQMIVRGEDFLNGLYNDVYSTNRGGVIGNDGKIVSYFGSTRRFSAAEFKKTIIRFPERVMASYVTLPSAEDEQSDYCIAYAIVINECDCRFYCIEKSTDGRYYVGTVNEARERVRICETSKLPEENFPLLLILFQQGI